MMTIAKFQIGKNGITDGVIEALVSLFKNHKQVRISMLKSSGRSRETIDKMGSEIADRLSKSSIKSPFEYKVIGFTIVMMKILK